MAWSSRPRAIALSGRWGPREGCVFLSLRNMATWPLFQTPPICCRSHYVRHRMPYGEVQWANRSVQSMREYLEGSRGKRNGCPFFPDLLEDAMDNIFDRAIIISADGDHVPAIRCVRRRFPGKQIFAATPPGRHNRARDEGSGRN